MQNYYEILGVNSSASLEEIRRAYRILARRYHPDVNPGKNSEERFKQIASAYSVLSDTEKRKAFDHEHEQHSRFTSHSKARSNRRAQERYKAAEAAKKSSNSNAQPYTAHSQTQAKKQPIQPTLSLLSQLARKSFTRFSRDLFSKSYPQNSTVEPSKKTTSGKGKFLSIIEVSITLRDAVLGAKKTIEISEPEGLRKVSIKVPPGMKNGSVLRLRSRSVGDEDLVCIMRVAHHPFMSIQNKGLVVEIPISVREALEGAYITVPSLDDSLVLKIPPSTQSGTEFRIKERGVTQSDNSRGDLFYRVIIKIPTAVAAVGLSEVVSKLDNYYESPVRATFPKSLLE